MSTEKKKGLFKGLASLFVEEVNTTPVNQPQPTQAPVVQATQATATLSQQPMQAQSIPVNPSPRVTIDNELLDTLCVVLEEQKLPSPNYLTLKNASRNEYLVKTIPDNTTRMSCAFESIKAITPSATKANVIKSIESYVDCLETERNNGLQQLSEKRHNEIDNKEKEIEDAKLEIERLQALIQEKSKFVLETTAEVNTKRQEFDSKELTFNATFDYLIRIFNEDKEKLNTILND